jgi:hypothetical protein
VLERKQAVLMSVVTAEYLRQWLLFVEVDVAFEKLR